MKRLGFLVTDASPLITLAAGDGLDCLTMPGLPVLIPDMVYAEVTQDTARIGATTVLDWVRRNRGQVRVVLTEVYAEFLVLRNLDPNIRSRGRGEGAAAEVLNIELAAEPGAEAILVYEDNDLRSATFGRALPPRVTLASTGDLLRELEAAGRIQSSDQILDAAAALGRSVARQREGSRDEAGRDFLRTLLAGNPGPA